jgi:hypothetical protein
VKEAALRLAENLKKEDGVQNGVNAFHKKLPIENGLWRQEITENMRLTPLGWRHMILPFERSKYSDETGLLLDLFKVSVGIDPLQQKKKDIKHWISKLLILLHMDGNGLKTIGSLLSLQEKQMKKDGSMQNHAKLALCPLLGTQKKVPLIWCAHGSLSEEENLKVISP